jgi:hypothetical protein
MAKRANESTDSTACALFRVNDENLMRRFIHENTRPEKKGIEALKDYSLTIFIYNNMRGAISDARIDKKRYDCDDGFRPACVEKCRRSY